MKKLLLLSAVALLLAGLNSCMKTDTKDFADENGLTSEVKAQISALGFSTEGAFAADGGYIVEGDIFLTEEDLHGHNHADHANLIVGNEEQYRTFNLVTGLPRNITVGTSGSVNANVSAGIDAAIARYNAENLQLTFQRVSGSGDITINIVNGGSYIASAGFPDSNGNPYPTVNYNRRYQNYSLGFVTTVIAHEIGHCIGFRHTDYMNRSYSCGSGGNEGQETTGVGAVHIPGTPTGPDPNSWMLSCLSSSTDRPFNANDKTALNYLY
jgi:hypothetical protein